ncbi:hypothetical protein [Vibrio phage P23]|nr:hypothetical protein [Vibrio phage P23]
MITKKEDLYGTHVLLCDKEAAEIYVRLINEFEISEIELGCNDYNENAIEVHKSDKTSSGWNASFTEANKKGLDAGSRRLAISDLKPRTRTEYEKVKYSSAWKAAKDHEERKVELWRKSDLCDAIKGNNWKAIQSPSEAAQYHFDLYRKVEKEIDWRDEVSCDFAIWFDDGYVGMRCQRFSEENFLELCRVVIRANGEIE